MVNRLRPHRELQRYSSKIYAAHGTPLTDHLLPEDSPFHHWDIRGDYHLSVSRRLLPEIERRPVIATVVCLPSFDPEWALRIHGSEHLGFALTLTLANTQIYCTGQDADVDVSTHNAELSNALARHLLDIWCNMLRDAKYRASATAGLDGVAYHFLCHKTMLGYLCGQTWSPDPETTAGHFVSLAHSLHDFVLADTSNRAQIESQLESEMEWFRDIPIRPPLRENATTTLQKTITQLLEYHERGIMTDAEIAGQIAYAFDHVRYPSVLEILDIIELIPEPMRTLIRARSEE
jgi:hypothetical protein